MNACLNIVDSQPGTGQIRERSARNREVTRDQTACRTNHNQKVYAKPEPKTH